MQSGEIGLILNNDSLATTRTTNAGAMVTDDDKKANLTNANNNHDVAMVAQKSADLQSVAWSLLKLATRACIYIDQIFLLYSCLCLFILCK